MGDQNLQTLACTCNLTKEKDSIAYFFHEYNEIFNNTNLEDTFGCLPLLVHSRTFKKTGKSDSSFISKHKNITILMGGK